MRIKPPSVKTTLLHSSVKTLLLSWCYRAMMASSSDAPPSLALVHQQHPPELPSRFCPPALFIYSWFILSICDTPSPSDPNRPTGAHTGILHRNTLTAPCIEIPISYLFVLQFLRALLKFVWDLSNLCCLNLMLLHVIWFNEVY